MGVRFALILVILVAAFLRLWQFQDIPPGIYPDEAMNATDAIRTLETRQPQVFYPANNGREGLFISVIHFNAIVECLFCVC